MQTHVQALTRMAMLGHSGRAEADILFSVCFQICGSFEAGAKKPASDDAGTGKRLEPETGFCAVLTSTALFQKSMLKRVCASANIAY